ncbi:hypothetical protein D8B26_006263 [Coccidioides posadasii str. Silveira]|uniref:Uncharacterized protein n=1 Tax=Coccidioides posadasii (strain RMSCC 757 / Silveira) TaxID=443226 RepID=E9CSL0_COCPS|nr:hypothetical protein CPSG_00569 [Coccidioides posadasii str. Silveira]QVM11617.1 hypothetical protein D8B26_006263 [Coccidioides posadasii str. Silveira]
MPYESRDEEEGLSGRTAVSSETDDILDYDSAASGSRLNITSEGDPTTSLPLPVWLTESSKAFKWKWVPLPLRKAARTSVGWLKGPQPPQDLRFNPLLPSIQETPIRLLNRFLPKRKHKILLLLFAYFSWFLSWSLVLRHSVSAGHIEGYGQPHPISCSATYWSGGNQCGLNGYDCRPFNASTFTFRCPAFCSSLILLNPHTVGNQTLNYQPLIVGGPKPGSSDGIYRADSFICQAAIHAGVISDSTGGCGVVELTGTSHSYPSSSANGFTSTSFLSTFPKSFRFLRLPGSQSDCPQDLRWPLFAITASTIVLISIFTTSPAVFFFSTFFILMLHVGLVSDPPSVSQVRELISLHFARLLPASFIAYILYLYCAVPLLRPLSSPPMYQLSKTILYLTPAFIGALNNYTFAVWIPIQRLTPYDLKNQPGAPVALVIVLIIVVMIVLCQMWYIRMGGLFFRYLKIYATMGIMVLILLVLPGFRLRIHHYILAMLLMPGTGFPTRTSLIFQGLLLGLFVNGVARWGFASIIQTPSALGERPSPGGKDGWWGATSPNITNSSVSISLPSAPEYRGNGNITFHLWEPERMEALQVDGVSVLVNDVERWRGYVDEDKKGDFTWYRRGHRGLDIEDEEDDDEAPEDLFFRFAFLRGSTAGKYGGVAVWNRDGSWIPPPPPRT